ncbi:MAG TPA: FGGY-family carbohydrate kinase [Solirubrobacteraceae bacterium]|nr:FGGY-family carbohydrate kinase [Solirubrobacteraceae bacterium]
MTSAARTFAAVDLGAESGRVMLGRLRGDSIELREVHRFANNPVPLPDGLHWNVLALFSETVAGLSVAATGGERLSGIGVDAWGVDYGLLDRELRLLGIPFHYRDRRTDGMIERVAECVPLSELYARTGIQTMPINTIFQLAAEAGGPIAGAAEHIALIPDLLGLWLTGAFANEATIASTTGLIDARTGSWANDLAIALGLPAAALRGTPREPGQLLGQIRHDQGAIAHVPLYSVASHDTASAFVATPVSSANAAILSSGTWSLLGVELETPILDPAAAAMNLTNERGAEGTIRLLRNVMGLWLLQECRRFWEGTGASLDYDELERLARSERDEVPLFDPDHPSLLHHGDMPSRIATLCGARGQRPPRNAGEYVRSILVSLACKYNLVLHRLRSVTARPIEQIHVIGGGVRNRALCQLTADVTGLPLLAGPVEAAALGNLLMQAYALGDVGSLAEMRELVGSSFAPERYEPSGDQSGVETYERFLALTGLSASTPEPMPA